MKKSLLLICLSLTVMTSAFADCESAYRKASQNRYYRNLAIVTTGSFALAAGPIFFVTGTAATLMASGYIIGIAGVAPALGDWKTNFDEIRYAVDAAKFQDDNKHLNRLTRKAIAKAGLEESEELKERAAALLVEGYENETFCPIVKEKKNGNVRRAVFNQPALVKYLSENL